MKLPRDISGAMLVKTLCKEFNYTRVHQVGSHIVLETEIPIHHRIAVPDHDSLRIGTLNSILKAVAQAKGIDKRKILDFLD